MPTGALCDVFAEWRENIKIGTRAAMQRPEVLDKVRCSARRHLMPPKKEKPVSPANCSPAGPSGHARMSMPCSCADHGLSHSNLRQALSGVLCDPKP